MSIGIGSRVLTTLCKVNIVVQENTTPNNVHMVVIDGVTYKNGEAVTLEPGIYSLIWASGNGGIFSSWSTSGNLSVADPSAEETDLEVTCGGTLTLNLVACPSGEQIINGGFETGDFTGWTHVGSVSVSSQYAHTGVYSILAYQGWAQSNDMNVHKDCISSFGFWAYEAAGRSYAQYKIIYTDGTESAFTIPDCTADWTYIDVLPNVADGKRVKNIYFVGTSTNPVWEDDVSLVC